MPNYFARKSEVTHFLVLAQSGGCILALSLLLFLPISLWSIGIDKTLLWTIGICAMLILLMPFFPRKRFDIFEPIGFVMLTTLFGITLRAIFIALYDNDTVRNELLLGKDHGSLLKGGIVVLISLLALVTGYIARTPKINIRKFAFFRKDRWSNQRLAIVIICFLTIGSLATALYIREMGITSLVISKISKKHFAVVEGAEYKYSALGYYRWAASLSAPAFYLFLIWFATIRKKWLSLSGVTVVGLGMLAAFFPFINSSRGGVIGIFIAAMVLWHYLRSEIKPRMLLWSVLIVVAVFITLTAFRQMRIENLSSVGSYFTGETILNKLVGNRNLFGISKTGHIINAVPQKIPYQYGRSFFSFFFAPIPRSVWPDKPPVRLGAMIGQVVYETKDESGMGGGVPPGFVPELYLNFGIPGVFVGMFMLGWWLKFIYLTFRPHLQTNKNACIVYTIIVFASSFQLLGGDFTGAIIGILTDCIPIGLSIWFIGGYPPSYVENA